MDTKLIENKWRQGVSRRGFLKVSAAACAVAATPTMLVGCKTVKYPPNDWLAEFQGSGLPTEKRVFEAAMLGPIKVKNRLARSATTFRATDEFGRPTQKLLDVYSELGQGGVGTIITGMNDNGLLL